MDDIGAPKKDFYCISCRKLLFKWVKGDFVIQIKCNNCKIINTIFWERDIQQKPATAKS